MKKDEETGELVADNDTRQVTMYIDKNRLSATQHIGFRLYLLLTGNFSEKEEEKYKDFTKPHNPYA